MGDPRQTSGEFQAVLLNVLNDVKTDGRENRQKLETVLIRLAEGDGRMERIELQGKTSREHLADIKIQLTNFDTRLTAL